MIGPPDDEIEDSPEKQQQLARIARPAPDALQPVVARGLGPATGSTEDLTGSNSALNAENQASGANSLLGKILTTGIGAAGQAATGNLGG